MRMICDVQTETKGAIFFNGKNIHDLGEKYRNILGYLPQNFGYYPNFTNASSKAPAAHPIRDARRRLAPVRRWFFSNAWSAALAWFAIAIVLVAALGWFFVFSPYGAPAAPAYAAY